jgi:hypothetical protein
MNRKNRDTSARSGSDLACLLFNLKSVVESASPPIFAPRPQQVHNIQMLFFAIRDTCQSVSFGVAGDKCLKNLAKTRTSRDHIGAILRAQLGWLNNARSTGGISKLSTINSR